MHWHRRRSETDAYTFQLMALAMEVGQQTGWVFFIGGLESKRIFLDSSLIFKIKWCQTLRSISRC